AATEVIVAIECQYKALKGTDSLLQTIARVKKRLNPKLKIAGFLPTMYQSRNSLDKRTLESIQKQLSPIATVFSPLPSAPAIAEGAEMGKPLATSSNKHKTTLKLFDELAIRNADLAFSECAMEQA
ncbi:MAG: ParA family protein, partial [Prochloraceae cyanobacterium]